LLETKNIRELFNISEDYSKTLSAKVQCVIYANNDCKKNRISNEKSLSKVNTGIIQKIMKLLVRKFDINIRDEDELPAGLEDMLHEDWRGRQLKEELANRIQEDGSIKCRKWAEPSL
jgi:hypothetical protein